MPGPGFTVPGAGTTGRDSDCVAVDLHGSGLRGVPRTLTMHDQGQAAARPAKAGQRFDQRGASRPAAMLMLLSALVVAWLAWSGLYKPLLLVLGFFSCMLCVYLADRMGFFNRLALVRVITRLPGYWVWVFREVIVSSWDVARTILHPNMPISPTVVEIDTGTDNEAVQVILANSITLSPGTVTLDLHQGKLKVHCLTHAGAEALLSGEAQRRAIALEQH